MSRVGKTPIVVPSDVTVNLSSTRIEVTGKLGKLSLDLVPSVVVHKDDNILKVQPRDASIDARSNWGTVQRRIANMVSDVSKGVTKNLDMVGVGYRASVQGRNIVLQVGYSHDVTFPLPEGIIASCPKPTSIDITGFDRQLVGQIAAEVKRIRPPEPYKGKGIKEVNERILRKEGKKK